MNKSLAVPMQTILAEMFPRSVYAIVFQLGSADSPEECDFGAVETTTIVPCLSPMSESLVECGVDIKKHMKEAIPEIEKILAKALSAAIDEAAENLPDTEADEE